MRNNENNITFNVRNITLYLENIISFHRILKLYLTEKPKIITLCSVIIILSFVNIINTSALSYQSSVGVGFTFNPTLSVSISPSDLVISNLTPGTTGNSNIINVSVATNAAYGCTLSTIMNGDNSNLVHTNGTNIFSSIATNADLSNLDNSEDTNIWGYSYKDNTVETPTWSNYNGLSSSNSTVLLDTNSNNSNVEANGIDSIDFKMAAKAASTQASGTYTGVINFTAVTKPTPINLAESYFAAGKTRHNGYYAMQDMTSEICNNTEVIGEGSQTELIDLRDNKVYWATKLADGHCWMTQNLDLDLDSSRTYTHWDTDLGWTIPNESETWQPSNSTIENITDWIGDYGRPSSVNPGNIYYYTSNSDADDIQYDSLQECTNAGHNDCMHYHAGNYYNRSATIAGNDSDIEYSNASNSICPAKWRLPIGRNENNSITEIADLVEAQNIVADYYFYNNIGFIQIRRNPLYFTRSGFIEYIKNDSQLRSSGNVGFYQTSTYLNRYESITILFNNTRVFPFGSNGIEARRRISGSPIRCLAR